jgi:MYXO-CTERM domain-containing protein
MWLLLATVALAGYGDPTDGVPDPAERELFVWTDAARVDVGAFRDELPCWGEIPAEQRAAHLPLAWSDGLGAAARDHSVDMARTGNFSHGGPGDTTFEERLRGYYDGYLIGENIAAGFRSPRNTVLAWLCSEGHRANLLSDDYLELGTGESRTYWTQDFGANGERGPVLRMGAHTTEGAPSGSVRLLADLGTAEAPDRVDAVVDGDRLRMDLLVGVEPRGIWSVDVEDDGACHVYWFTAALAAGSVARFPEAGAYTFGPCEDLDDVEAAWLAPEAITDLEAQVPDAEGCGCDTGSGGGWMGVIALGLVRRRRR